MSKKELEDLRDAKLRADPEYQDLCKLLDRQTEAQKDRLTHGLTQPQGCEHSQDPGADIMEYSTKALDARIVELKSEGLSFSQVADRLNAEGFKNQAGGTLTRKSVAGRYYRFKGKDVSQLCEPCDDLASREHFAIDSRHCEDSTGTADSANVGTICQDGIRDEQEPLSPEPSQTCESSHSALLPEMIEDVRALVREELQAISEEAANLAKGSKADVEMPPQTPRVPGSKKFQGKRATLPGCRVDQVLYDLFRNECNRLDVSASGLMQRVLWLYFNKPRLSFEFPI